MTPDRRTGKVKLEFTGQEAIEVTARLVADASHAFGLRDPDVVVIGPSEFVVDIDPAKCQPPARATLEVTTHDGDRGPAEEWVPRPLRTHFVDLEAGLAQGPELIAEPSALFFSAGQERRALKLVNRGDLPATLDVVQLPPGMRLDGTLTMRELLPGQSVTLTIVRSDSALAGSVEVLDRGEPLLSIPAILLPAPPAKMVARYVVGIDFGTSNTTIGIRDTRTEQVEFLTDPGASAPLTRFPSVVLLRGPDSLNWAYGTTALAEFDPNRHQIVHELKTYLRSDREPFARKWETCTVDAILAWYLRRLRLDIIEPALVKLSPGSAPDVHFVFCLPVLDSGPQYELQRLRMERAIAAAGFGEMGEISFQYEPVAAALFFLQGHKSGAPPHTFDDGEAILVFDSGGGTTDITLFTARETAGEIAMEDVRQVGSHRTVPGSPFLRPQGLASGSIRGGGEGLGERSRGGLPTEIPSPDSGEGQGGGADLQTSGGPDAGGTPAVRGGNAGGTPAVQFAQFGGTTLTQLLGFYKDLELRNAGNANRMLAFANEYDARDYRRFDESLALTAEGFVSTVPPDALDGGESLKWHRRFPRTYRLVEVKKRALAARPNPKDAEVLISDKLGADVMLVREDLDLIVDVEMKKVLKPMLAELLEDGIDAAKIRHVFPVGGNCSIPRVLYWLGRHFSDRQLAQLTPDQRMMAVPMGSVYAYDPTLDKPPYSVEIVDAETGKRLVDCSALYQLRGAAIQKQVRLGAKQSFGLQARATYQGDVVRLADIHLRNEGTEIAFVDWRVRLDGSRIALDANSGSGWSERWSYVT
ncbi:MAG: hypothetical protein K1X67_25725 [Fimbriimonadaceae bacterium]|nr:hypothetical protein [Fimbriimonadaceae bacterium]